MMDKELLPDFYNYLTKLGEGLEKTSKYQIGRVDLDTGKVLIYQSGIIIFEDDPKVREAIDQFLDEQGITNPDFEKYQSVVSDFDDEEERGWNETPKGVWLTSKQIKALMETLNTEAMRTEGEKHETAKYSKGNQTLVINSNNVVYTVGGYDRIIELLREVIEKNNPYEQFDRIVILDEQGRWERVGPVCLTLVDFMMPEVTELLLSGVKDDGLSRSTNHLDFISLVEERTSFQTLLITPKELNSQVDTREEYRKYLDTKYLEFLEGQLLNFNDNTLLLIDSELTEYLEHEHQIIVDREKRDTPAIGISSTVTNATIQKWKEDWYHQLGFEVERHNSERLLARDNSSDLMKLFLY